MLLTMALRDRDEPSFAERVCLGEIAGAHGVKGVVRVRSFTAEPADIAAYGTLTDASGEKEFELKMTGTSKSHLLAEIPGINDRDAAAALKGTRLYAPRSRLPAPGADEYYFGDLVGLAVDLATGARLGTVTAVEDFGAGVMIEVAREGGRDSVLVPFTNAFVPEVDLAGGRLVVDPPPGLLEPAEPAEAAEEAAEEAGEGGR
jgi:16S rRNA processing protein RimM